MKAFGQFKSFRHFAAALLAAIVVVSATAALPVQTDAAEKTTITSVKLFINGLDENEKESNCVFLSVGTRGSGQTTKYQYKVFVSGKKVKTAYSNVYSLGSKRCCKAVYPKNTACAISVRACRGGSWSSWSPCVAVVPVVPGVYAHTRIGSTNGLKLKWEKVNGVTDYAVYVKAGSSGVWKKAVSTKNTTVDLRTYDGKNAFKRNVTYHYKIVARKKLDGKYVGSKLGMITDYKDYLFDKYSAFKFN